jgi:hypothetical protein
MGQLYFYNVLLFDPIIHSSLHYKKSTSSLYHAYTRSRLNSIKHGPGIDLNMTKKSP